MERGILREYKDIVFDNARWTGFDHRPGDIFVCTPAKCGTTWTQTILAALLFPAGNVPGQVSIVSPWIDSKFEAEGVVLKRLAEQRHRRFIKTHTPADGIPLFADASYLAVLRDPRDVFMSWLNHLDNMRTERLAEIAGVAVEQMPERLRPDDVHEYFGQWLDEGHLFSNFMSWWEIRDAENVTLIHYNDLKADLEGEMRRLAAILDIDVPDAAWPAMITRCTFEGMKARPAEIGDFTLFEGGAQTFLFKGTNGRWHDVLDDEDLARYDKRVTELLPPDAREWIEGGSLALGVRP